MMGGVALVGFDVLKHASLIATEHISVYLPHYIKEDVFGGEDIEYGEPVEVDAVVAPGATRDLDASRPEGVRVSFTVHMPREWNRPLRDALIGIRGSRYKVIGDPQKYTDDNTPGLWTMACEVEAYDG